MTIRKPSTGYIPFHVPAADKPCSTYYKVVGDLTSNIPLIIIHGGPGAGHEYLLPLTDLHAHYRKTIILYDQLGCGRSTRLPEKASDKAFWTVELFIAELENLISFLGLRARGFDILGQSWGGMLGGMYAAIRPIGLRKLILANAPASVPLMLDGMNALISRLPEDVQKVIEECHRQGDFESDKYKNACLVFYRQHLCRLDPWPTEVNKALKHLEEDPTVYGTMLGPSEFMVTGSLREWEGFRCARNINVETLLINGRYDEIQDISVTPWFRAIERVKWVSLANSSHMAHFEERERYMQVVGDFLELEQA